jgi:hypothetical protein
MVLLSFELDLLISTSHLIIFLCQTATSHFCKKSWFLVVRNLSIYLSIYTVTHPPIHPLSIYLPTNPSIYPSIDPPMHPSSIYLSICLSVSLSPIYLPIHLPAHPSIHHLPVCLSIHPSIHLPIHLLKRCIFFKKIKCQENEKTSHGL